MSVAGIKAQPIEIPMSDSAKYTLIIIYQLWTSFLCQRILRPASAMISSSLQNVSLTYFSRSWRLAQSQNAEQGITETPCSQISWSENAQSLALFFPFSSCKYFSFTSHREMSTMMKLDPFGIQKSMSRFDLTNYWTNWLRNFSSFFGYSIM